MPPKLVKVNKEKVKPFLCTNPYSRENVKGYDLIAELYANIFLCAKKKSGKTSVIGKLLIGCSNKATKVIIFASTVHKDPTYKEIIKKLKEKHIDVETHMSIVENGVDHLKELTQMLQMEADEEDKELKKQVKKIKFVSFSDSEDEDEPKYKPKKQAPEYILVFDDIANELSSPSLSYFMSRNRHFLAKTIVSSQYWHHLSLQARQQLDYVMIFKNIPEDKLKLIHREADMSVPYQEFLEMYYDATAEPYSFLYVDLRSEVYGKRLNEKYCLEV